ncbi:helix-turn-helix transcriptional regulator [Sphingomonas sp. RT2P30]|uniref:helix-turn-helix transcriptional regulator n=1 Tax=Parasphingomonas halimpatiens TaxID=3096162 RepID=UPI003FA77D12
MESRQVAPPIVRLLGQAIAAAYLGVSERTFEQQWRSGALPEPHRIGRRLLWDRKLLDRWVDDLSGIGEPQNYFGD